jgi:hypothetical protein
MKKKRSRTMANFIFRGKTEQGEWVEGWYARNTNGISLILSECKDKDKDKAWLPWITRRIIPESLGMSTNLKDKNGKENFGSIPIDGKMSRGGDVAFDKKLGWNYVVQWDERKSKFYLQLIHSWKGCDWKPRDIEEIKNLEIIGNQFDNPDLLEKEE